MAARISKKLQSFRPKTSGVAHWLQARLCLIFRRLSTGIKRIHFLAEQHMFKNSQYEHMESPSWQ